jgi:hypothetical protein
VRFKPDWRRLMSIFTFGFQQRDTGTDIHCAFIGEHCAKVVTAFTRVITMYNDTLQYTNHFLQMVLGPMILSIRNPTLDVPNAKVNEPKGSHVSKYLITSSSGVR